MFVQTMIQKAKRAGYETKLHVGKKVRLITKGGDYIMPINGEVRDVYLKRAKKPPVKVNTEVFLANFKAAIERAKGK